MNILKKLGITEL